MGGLGLRLAIVKTFVEADGGRAIFENREGIGTRFRSSKQVKSSVKNGGGR